MPLFSRKKKKAGKEAQADGDAGAAQAGQQLEQAAKDIVPAGDAIAQNAGDPTHHADGDGVANDAAKDEKGKKKGKGKKVSKKAAKAAEDDEAQRSAEAAAMSAAGDGGATFYREMEEEARRARQTAASSNPGAAPMQDLVEVKTTKAGKEAISKQSARVQQKRLMKELKDIHKCDSVKNGVFTVELFGDNLFEWDVKLYKFDEDSLIHKDLSAMTTRHGIDNVWIRMSFPQNFPFSPPFVRVIAPFVQGGYVLSGGAICLELLTPDGWVSSYTMEAVILQVMTTMMKGKARVVTTVRKPFNFDEARSAYDYLVKTHGKYGWKDTPKEEG